MLGWPTYRSVATLVAIALCVAGAWSCASIAGLHDYASPEGGTDGAAGDGITERTYAETVLEDAPLAYWRFGDSVTPTAVDSSGYGVNGVYQDGVTLGAPGALANDPDTCVRLDSGKVSGGIRFDLAMNVAFSFEVWVKPAPPGGQQGLAGYFTVNGATGYDWYLGLPVPCSAGTCRPMAFFPFGEIALNSSGPIVIADEWNHIAVTYDMVTLRLFIDGNADATQSTGQAIIVADGGSFAVGEWINSGEFTGWMDEFATYDHALSRARILAHYHAGIGTP